MMTGVYSFSCRMPSRALERNNCYADKILLWDCYISITELCCYQRAVEFTIHLTKVAYLFKGYTTTKKYLKRKDRLLIDEGERTLSTKFTGGDMNQTFVNKSIRYGQVMMHFFLRPWANAQFLNCEFTAVPSLRFPSLVATAPS